MSGGSFGYLSGRMRYASEEIENIIENNSSEELDTYGFKKGYGFCDDVIKELKEGVKYLRIASIYERRIDWLISCDDSENNFLSRLKKELLEEGVDKS